MTGVIGNLGSLGGVGRPVDMGKPGRRASMGKARGTRNAALKVKDLLEIEHIYVKNSPRVREGPSSGSGVATSKL